eukprot:1676040-Prorocentrum_lima.AAC.1
MTSSLVGSEMCIRDRPSPDEGWQEKASACAKPGKGRCGGDHDCARAVSYTHLTLPTICSV